MDKELVEICKLFLTPATILFAAIAVAQTEGLKTGVSFIGAVLSGAWIDRVGTSPLSPDRRMALAIAGVFLLVAAFSFCIHLWGWWCQPRKIARGLELDWRGRRRMPCPGKIRAQNFVS